MAVWDYNGSTSTAIATIYDYNGSASTAINSVYDYNGSTSTQVYAATIDITNMLTNPYLLVAGSASTSGWTTGGTSWFGIAKEGDNVRVSTYAYDASSAWIKQAITFTSASKYYVKIYGNVGANRPFFLDNNAGSALLQMPSTLTTAGAIITGSSFGGNYFRMYGTTTSTSSIYPLWCGISLVDLTATFGSGTEPNVSWCNTNIPIFSGTTAVPRP